MYKVFIKESSVTLTDQCPDDGESYRNIYQLQDLRKRLEEKVETEHIVICNDDLEKLWKDWCGMYQIIEAAGGIVLNERGEVLMIHRLGKWDLPKGKLEQGEKKKVGAIREVMEECAIPEPSVVSQLPDSYHTYQLGEQPILKRTYWFEMTVAGAPDPAPQEEEDISEAIWCPVDELEPKLANSYANIVNLIRGFLVRS